MNQMLLIKSSRLALAISVSLWLMGGCLFGCSNTLVRAAEVSRSVHSAHSCCTRPKAAKRHCARVPQQALAGMSHELHECPFMVNKTAATNNSGGSSMDSDSVLAALLPNVEKPGKQAEFTGGYAYLPDRGLTNLRCCVFLI